jgi:hypothetical protein
VQVVQFSFPTHAPLMVFVVHVILVVCFLLSRSLTGSFRLRGEHNPQRLPIRRILCLLEYSKRDSSTVSLMHINVFEVWIRFEVPVRIRHSDKRPGDCLHD